MRGAHGRRCGRGGGCFPGLRRGRPWAMRRSDDPSGCGPARAVSRTPRTLRTRLASVFGEERKRPVGSGTVGARPRILASSSVRLLGTLPGPGRHPAPRPDPPTFGSPFFFGLLWRTASGRSARPLRHCSRAGLSWRFVWADGSETSVSPRQEPRTTKSLRPSEKRFNPFFRRSQETPERLDVRSTFGAREPARSGRREHRTAFHSTGRGATR